MATMAIRVGVVSFFQKFLDQIVANDNDQIEKFNQRSYNDRMKVAPGRLVDQVEEMLNKHREQGNHGARSPLPIFILAFGKDYSSTGLEKGQSIAMRDYVVKDDEGRFFKVRVDKHDQRVQIVLFSPSHPTAFSLASQFKLFCREYENRHTMAYTEYHGKHYPFALTLEDTNIFGTSTQIAEQDNLTVLVFDLSFNCNTPYFMGETNQSYLSLVQAVKIDDFSAKLQQQFYRQIVGETCEEIV